MNINFKSNKNLETIVNVVDINGKKVIADQPIQIGSSNSTHQINIANLTGGMYFINVYEPGKPAIQQKIIKFNR